MRLAWFRLIKVMWVLSTLLVVLALLFGGDDIADALFLSLPFMILTWLIQYITTGILNPLGLFQEYY